MAAIPVAIVGAAGSRGRWFVQQAASSPHFEVVALVDSLVEAAEAVARHAGITRAGVHTELSAALNDGACEAVIVATEDSAHLGPTLTALASGCSVLVEKPLATTLADCITMVEADERAGGKTMVGFNLRFAPFYRKMKEIAARGDIGRMLTIQADEFYHQGRTYFRRWNRFRQSSGGLWITKASHDFDLLYWMADRLPESVHAHAALSHFVPRPEAGERCSACPIEPDCVDSCLGDDAAYPPIWREIAAIRERNGWPASDLCLYNSEKDTFDHGIATVRFPGDLFAVYTLNVVAPVTDRRMRIAGSDGMIEGALSVPRVTRYQRARILVEPVVEHASYADTDASASHGGGDSKLLDDFARFVRGEISAPVAPVRAAVAVAMGLAATRSVDERRAVDLSSMEGWDRLVARLA